MLAQKLCSKPYKIVSSACRLQGSCRSDDRDDNQHHVDRRVPGLQSEDENQDKHAHHTIDTKADAANTCTDKDERQDYKQLQNYQRCYHTERDKIS